MCTISKITRHLGRCITLASFPGLPHIQFSICTHWNQERPGTKAIEFDSESHVYYKMTDMTVFCFVYFFLVLTDAVAFHSAHFGAGIGPIHLDNVGCTGNESHLIDCLRSPSVRCYYGHSDDAGVRCQGGSIPCNCCQCCHVQTLVTVCFSCMT